MPLKSLLPLLDVKAQFVSLQKDIRSSDEVVLLSDGSALQTEPDT
jgi:hypothetical protein